MIYFVPVSLVLYLALVVGCASAPALKNARVTPEGHREVYVGASTSGAHVPDLQVGLRGGIWPKFDLEGRLALFGLSGFEGRYALLDGEKFAASIGILLMAGGVSFDSTQTDPQSGEKRETRDIATQSVADFGFPVYVGYDLEPNLSIYFAPRLIGRQIQDGLATRNDTRVQLLGGVRIGETRGVYLESGAEYSSRDASWIGRFAVATFWN